MLPVVTVKQWEVDNMPSKRDKELFDKAFEKRDKRLYPLTVEEIAQRNSKIEAAEKKERMKKAKEYLDSLPPNTRKKAGGRLGTKALMEGGKVGRQVKGFGKARQVKKEVDTGPNNIVLRYKEGGTVKGKM